jgi:hypothetical protein
MPSMPEQPLPSRESPELALSTPYIGQIVMTWANTFLRFFDEGDGMYDHVVHRLPDGTYTGFFPSDTLKEQLLASRFPRHWEPIVGEKTMRWYVDSLLNSLAIPPEGKT